MIVRRSTIRNPDYLVISSFAERLFVREIQTYVSHIRTLLAVTHSSVVLRSKHTVLRAAFLRNARKLSNLSVTDNGSILQALERGSKSGTELKNNLEKLSEMRTIPRRMIYITFCLKIYKHLLRYTGHIGAYIPTKKTAAPTKEELTFLIENKYNAIRKKQVCTQREQTNKNENGTRCPLIKNKNSIVRVLCAQAHNQQENRARTKRYTNYLDIVRQTAYANILQRKALYYTIFFRTWRRGFASLPIKRQLYTVLRSPHTDKKSREQFKYEYRRKIKSYPSFVSIFTKRYIADRLTAGLGVKSKQTQIIYM